MRFPQLKFDRFVVLSFSTLIFAFACCPSSATMADGPSSLANRLKKLKQANEANAKQEGTQQQSGNPVYEKMLKSIAMVQTEDGTGTGWIVDVDQKLMVTNHHVIEGWLDCTVFFPHYKNGKLSTDPELTADESRGVYGVVVDSDISVDLALIKLEGDLPEGIVAMELADGQARAGQKIHSIAGQPLGSNSMWVYSTGHVRQVAEGMLANGYETTCLESDMATNQGNSGGPVCDDQGRVIAVVEGHRTDARLASIYVDLSVLVDYLSAALRCVAPESLEDLKFAADRHYDEDRESVAANLYTKAMKLDKGNPELFTNRGWCWVYLDDDDSAKADFEEAIKLDSTFAEAYAGLGRVARDDDDYQTAVKHFTNAIRNESDNIWYLNERASAYAKLSEFDDAKSDINRVLNYDSENSEALRQLAFVLFAEGDNQAALDNLNLVFDEYETDPETLVVGSAVLFNLGQYEPSLGLAVMAEEQDAEYPFVHFRKGVALLKIERYDLALQALAESVTRNPTHAEAVFFFGLALIHNDDVDGGLEMLAKSHELAPDDTAIEETYRSIQQELGVNKKSQQATLVSSNSAAGKLIGKWKAQINDGGTNFIMQLTLVADGTYSMVINISGPDGDSGQFTDAGTFQIDNGSLVTDSKKTGKTVRRPFSWQGPFLALYLDNLDDKALFARVP